ncbi:MAG: outer membrane beta-barrel protein [Chitinophagaceae bacterium]|nr:outer membrane beta-barrel protein [Chitinophagaceae bacterium]
MIFKQVSILALLLGFSSAYSQDFLKNISLEAFGGFANYQGELQEKTYTFSQALPAIAAGASYAITDKFSIRGLITYGNVKAADSLSTDVMRRQRNLSFRSKVYDASLTGVYEIFDIMEKRYTPYVFAGVSIFNMGPYAFDTSGKKVGLRNVGTEGQGLPEYPDRKKYNYKNFSIPFGAGIRFAVTRNVALGWEFRFNKTFTDYLDDVSRTYVDRSTLLAARGPQAIQMAYRGGELKDGNPVYPAGGTKRGNPKTKDWYYFSGVTVTFKLFNDRDLNTGNLRRGIPCPKNVY